MNNEFRVDSVLSLRAFYLWLLTNGKSEETARVYVSRVRGFLSFAPMSVLFPDKPELLAPEDLHAVALKQLQYLSAYLAERRKDQISLLSSKAIETAVKTYLVFTTGTVTAPVKESAQTINLQKESAKSRLIFFLIGENGLTAGECASLSLSDVVSTKASTYLRLSRRGRPCLVKVSKNATAALAEWTAIRATIATTSGALLLNSTGSAISSQGIEHLVRSLGHKNYMDISPSSLRANAIQGHHI